MGVCCRHVPHISLEYVPSKGIRSLFLARTINSTIITAAAAAAAHHQCDDTTSTREEEEEEEEEFIRIDIV